MKYIKLISLEQMYSTCRYDINSQRYYTQSGLDIVKYMYFMFGSFYVITNNSFNLFTYNDYAIRINGWYFDKHCIELTCDEIENTSLIYISELYGEEILYYIQLDTNFIINKMVFNSQYVYINKKLYNANIECALDIKQKYKCFYDKNTNMLQAYIMHDDYIQAVLLFKFDIDIFIDNKIYHKIQQINKIYKEVI